MQEVGIDMRQRTPQRLTDAMLAEATDLITMGCGDVCMQLPPDLQCVDWPLLDPKGQVARRRARDSRRHPRARRAIARRLAGRAGERFVKPRELIAEAEVPDGGTLRCYHHDGAYEVWIGHSELMSSRVFGSEQQLAELALERLGHRKAPRVLVGGLGMGFTLARTLELVPEAARVDVVELVPEIVQWNRELFGHCAGHPLEDARANLIAGDVREVLERAPGGYDVVLLDVDNGPDGLTRPDNDSIYNKVGLKSIHAALKQGGVLGVWSSGEDRAFEARLQRARFLVERHAVRARRTKGPRRVIWIAPRKG